MSTPCIFFDRDGIANVSPGPGYVEHVEDFHLIPAFLDALRVAQTKGYATAIVTNQRGVGIGRMSEETLHAIHDVLRAAVRDTGLSEPPIYYCTADDHQHPDRKPNPGMLLAAAREHDLDLARSWMIGDNEKDVLAGQRAGCRTILVDHQDRETAADHRVATMSDVVTLLGKTL